MSTKFRKQSGGYFPKLMKTLPLGFVSVPDRSSGFCARYFISAYFARFTVFRSAILNVILSRNSGQIYIKQCDST